MNGMPDGKVIHEPRITSADVEERAMKLNRAMRRLRFAPAISGTDSRSPNGLWLDIRPMRYEQCVGKNTNLIIRSSL